MKNIFKNKNNFYSAGFTLTEILLIVTILSILITSASSIFGQQSVDEELNAKTLEVLSLVNRAHDYSMVGFQGDVWGIRVLDNSTDCTGGVTASDCIILFKGDSYADRDSGFDQILNLGTGNIYMESSQSNQFYFGFHNGWLSTSTGALSQQLIVLKNGISDQKSIVISPAGLTYVFKCGETKLYDQEGQSYRTVEIGERCWMAENLNTGTMLTSGVSEPSDNDIIEKWCYDDDEANCNTYGGLYNWDESQQYVMTSGARGICPMGWQIPTHNELVALEANYAAATNGTDLLIGGSSGFDLLKGGQRTGQVTPYDSVDDLAAIWSSDEHSEGNAYYHYVLDPSTAMESDYISESYGFSIRCIKRY